MVRDIKRATRRKFSADEKIRIVLAGLRGEDSIAELCRREGLHQNLYYRWSKEFLEAGKKRLAGDTERDHCGRNQPYRRGDHIGVERRVDGVRREDGAFGDHMPEVSDYNELIAESRLLPSSEEGDVLLIANAGAYGRVMASSYNRRKPAEELILDPHPRGH